jgi:predicted aspartyl protease
MPLSPVLTEICHIYGVEMFRLLMICIVSLTSVFGATLVTADSYRTIPMNQKRLATYYIGASLHGSGDVEFMVDTGAGYTTINENTLALLMAVDNAVYVGELTGVMADGSEHRLPVYRIKRLVLGQDCELVDVEAAVFPRDTRMLLGLSALKKAAPFVFSTDPPALSLSNCGTSLADSSGAVSP